MIPSPNQSVSVFHIFERLHFFLCPGMSTLRGRMRTSSEILKTKHQHSILGRMAVIVWKVLHLIKYSLLHEARLLQ